MRLLLDSCVWGGALARLREAGHDAVWAGEWAHDPGDREVLRTAYEQSRILVTLDKDFGERAIVFAEPHCGIGWWGSARASRLATVSRYWTSMARSW